MATKSFKNRAELATYLGISRMSVGRILNRDDSPVSHDPPFTQNEAELLEAFRETLQENRNEDANDDPIKRLKDNPRAVADVRLKMERAALLKLEREHRSGKLMHVEEIRREIHGAMSEFKNSMQNLSRSLGRCPAGIKVKIDKEVRARLRDLGDRMSRSVDEARESQSQA